MSSVSKVTLYDIAIPSAEPLIRPLKGDALKSDPDDGNTKRDAFVTFHLHHAIHSRWYRPAPFVYSNIGERQVNLGGRWGANGDRLPATPSDNQPQYLLADGL